MSAVSFRLGNFVRLWRHRFQHYGLPTRCTLTQRHDWHHAVQPGRPGRWSCSRCTMHRITWPEGERKALPEARTWRQRRLGFTYFEIPTTR